MQDVTNIFDKPLADLSRGDWLRRLANITSEHGSFRPLGRQHFAACVEEGETLLVTFETMQGIRALDEDAQPMGWEMVKTRGWSHMAIVSDGDTWFRDPNIYSWFDELTDDGYFDAFDRILFYGAGPCGYAAAAYSVAAPGSRVLAIQPQATLEPELTAWDDRFIEERRRDFTSRYGFAPDMSEAAMDTYLIYDPAESLDAMHAALFERANTTRLPARYFGTAIQTDLMDMRLLHKMLELAIDGTLDRAAFAHLMRARRSHPPYLRNLMLALDLAERPDLVTALCRNVTARMKAPKFARRLKELQAAE